MKSGPWGREAAPVLQRAAVGPLLVLGLVLKTPCPEGHPPEVHPGRAADQLGYSGGATLPL